MNDAPKTDNALRLAKCYSADDESGEVDWRKVAMSMDAHGRALERQNALLRDALAEARLLLDHERRLGGMRCFANRALTVLSSILPNPMMSGPEDNANPSSGSRANCDS